MKDRNELIKVTADYKTGKPGINRDPLTFGRSAYLCYNKACIKTALKKNKLGKHLKVNIPDELKGQLLDELRNS